MGRRLGTAVTGIATALAVIGSLASCSSGQTPTALRAVPKATYAAAAGAYHPESAAPASAGTRALRPRTASTTGALVSQMNYKCIDDPASNTANGTRVVTWGCHSGSNQQWVQQGDGTFRVLGKCLDTASAQQGSGVIINDCTGRSTQQWQASGNALVQRATGYCLDIAGGWNADGAQLVVWNCQQSINQKWNIPAAPAAQPLRVVIDGPLFSKMNGMCLSAPATYDGARPYMNNCDGTSAQRWISYDDGTVRVNGGKCLDAGSGAEGSAITVQTCNPASRVQTWGWTYWGNGQWVANGRCLDIAGGNRSAGAGLVLWHCTDSINQNWIYQTIPDASSTTGYRRLASQYEISTASANDFAVALTPRCLDTQTTQASYSSALVAYHCHGGQSQRFWFGGDGTIHLYNGCLDGSKGRGGQVVFAPCSGSSYQRWYTNLLPGRDIGNVLNNFTQRAGQIQNAATGLCIDISGATNAENAHIINWTCSTLQPGPNGTARAWNQMWGVGTANYHGRALVIQRQYIPWGGHSAWAIQLPDGRWLAGAWDGITPISTGGTVGKGDYNGHWRRIFPDESTVLAFFRTDGNVGNFGANFGQHYNWYKEFDVPIANSAAAFSIESQSWDWGYGVLGNNCVDVTYKVLKSYGLNLHNPTMGISPNVWFNIIGGTQHAL